MAQGTTSLESNTVYALSDAATQFSKAAHKGIVAFTFDDQAVARMEKQQKGVASHSKGVINEVLEESHLGLQDLWLDQQLVFLRLLEKLLKVLETIVGSTI
ncbi:hypothetical protein Dsin_002283 [Dipteronia sinensis]|uniref:Uncharacterized protein n=1 Tax=Dipteronia sinensis TaxID=43782 RepID=A0AAD9ZGA2_9ROSI|nr:hypothetical protein Dsin_033194 [Dipteronia sinensis]KAK3230402.1 hypothetical protein Dsin_002283 [Dipteronia sinensis]